MPFWDGPFTMLPAFEARTDAGDVFRTSDRRQFRHLAVVFAEQPEWRLTDLATRHGEIRESGGDLVIVAPPGVAMDMPEGVPVARDEFGEIAGRYRSILPEWRPPVVFVGDRYGELTATTDGDDPDLAAQVVRWIFSNEVQCAL